MRHIGQKASVLLVVLSIQCAVARGQVDSSNEARQLVPGAPVERAMKGSEAHRYRVSLAAGELLEVVVDQRGIDVVGAAFGPDGKKIAEVDSPNGTQGPEPVSVAAGASGVYEIEVRSLEAGAAPGRYEIRIEALLSAEQYRRRLADEQARDEAVIASLGSRAIPLASLTAGGGSSDLMPLKDVLRDVRVVGLGEATHGTREFFQVRHRLLEFLVKEMGYTVVAVEGSSAAFAKINEYVLHGRGDRARLLADQRYWILDTEEVAAIVDWIRAHNQTVPDERKVKLLGIDANANEIAMRSVADYLTRVAPERAPGAEALFEKIRPEDAKAIDFAPTAVPAAHLAEVYGLIGFMVLNKATFVRRTSAEEFETALHHLRLVAQFAEFNSAGAAEGMGTRDGYMAENLQHIVNGEKPSTRVVVLAHNAHVSKRGTGRFPAMGSYLRQAFGDGYYAFGFAFDRGSFQAQVAGPGRPRVQEFRLGPAPARTVDWYLARTGIPRFVVDLRRPPENEAFSQWLQATHRMRWVGAIFSDGWTEAQSTQPFVLSRDFDGLVFVDETTRARPTPTGRRTGISE
jgi:erythromycin esterase